MCKGYHIRLRFSTSYYPQGNGQAKATNKTICSILLKMVNDSHQDWHTRIPHALWAYRTSIQTPTRTTPFSLQDYITNEAVHQTRLDQLLLLDERRVNALEHLRTYKNRIKQAFNKNFKIHEFNIRDLVLKENQQTSQMEW